ncbi:DUF4339 domain-containing protein [Shewanella sp. OMA3-2]|uniref:DUF4339 domain-containing protein n=1 Tax=Shewanella sp. OMA3-2 TaxID=2908650 RepID=UPI001F2E2AD4|nr:DUF4339 domain-containing protein [Shewanella sp. OMA3-2]UJF22924.1 GYF domain-containing protein [Shewanella sp. OMA3-2]
MKKWFFSHDGDVTGPLTEVEAITFVQNQPNCYGWHPAFSQWLPVSHISEFSGLVSQPESPAQIPKELINEFTSKRRELTEKLVEMDESIKYSKTYLYELEQEINIYKRLTSKLSDEVRNNISTIESRYEGYQTLFEELIHAVSIAKSEIAEVTAEFDKRLEAREKDQASVPTPPQVTLDASITSSAASSASFEPLATKPTSIDPVATQALSLDPVATKSASLDPIASTGLSLDPVATKTVPVDPIISKTITLDNVAEIRPRTASLDPQPIRPSASMDNVAVRLKPGESIDDITPKKSQEKIDNIQFSEELKNNIEQKLEKVFEASPAVPDEKSSSKTEPEKSKAEPSAKLQGVTSILKSVFRGDKKVEPKQEVKMESPVSLAHSNDDLDDDLDDDFLDNEERNGTDGEPTTADKEGRMRRRSRRRR